MSEKETAIKAIEQIVNKETSAWNNKDVEMLLSLFHPDMVWPWPKHPYAHDPLDWILEWGRFNHERWGTGWQKLFDTHELVYNERTIKKIEISDECDGAFAVVDIDTLWRDNDGKDNHWKGRTCKVYSLVNNEWKMIMQTGALDYEDVMI